MAVSLSNSSVFPESTASCFELAASLGFDGVEVMVGVDDTSADVAALLKLSRHHGVPVVSVHAPNLLVTQNVWGSDPWGKLERSGEAAAALGCEVVVVHPPFRWQKSYARGFVEGIAELNRRHAPVRYCVENMYPWGTGGRGFQAYLPDWDPTDLGYEHLTLDLSHASVARQRSIDHVRAWGPRLAHVHLTDGTGKQIDEHLLPGEGDQDAWGVLGELARSGFTGQVVVEINTRRSASRGERAELLRTCLEQIRAALTAVRT